MIRLSQRALRYCSDISRNKQLLAPIVTLQRASR
jgi:hypothetical protein